MSDDGFGDLLGMLAEMHDGLVLRKEPDLKRYGVWAGQIRAALMAGVERPAAEPPPVEPPATDAPANDPVASRMFRVMSEDVLIDLYVMQAGTNGLDPARAIVAGGMSFDDAAQVLAWWRRRGWVKADGSATRFTESAWRHAEAVKSGLRRCDSVLLDDFGRRSPVNP